MRREAGTGRGTGDEVVELHGFTKSFDEFEAVRDLSLGIRRGEVFGFLGPNGAGKTTTIECIVGLQRPTGGSIRVLGLDPSRDRGEITRRVAVQPQSASLFDTLTVRETLELFSSFHEQPRALEEVLAEIGLQEQASERSKALSGGQTRRLLLGVALVADPEVLVLDEPSAGLDPAARQALWKVIYGLRDRGTTIILSTHHMDEATSVCDRVAIMVGGRLAALDSPDELVRQHASTSDVAFTVATTVSDADLASALEVPFTSDPVPGGTRVRVTTDDPDELIRRVTFARALRARELNVRQGSLEDIFLRLAELPDERRRRDTTAEGNRS
ncbi:ABC transporter ATP-binding protein [Curtobacterium sp. NPDC087080]|uniref:ABC transporter ATP-binding protein n=1 Tax=Curtobacterium sp. NPDC087080 TaxID=3363965 RepID=UPI00382B42FE